MWGIDCLEGEENKCAPRIVRWLDDFKKEWWDAAFESDTIFPQNLDKYDMDEFVRFKTPNLEGGGLAGFFSFYQTKNGSWWREPIDRKFFDRLDGKYLVLEPGLTHSRSKLCQVEQADLDYFKKHGKHHGCINGVRDPKHTEK